MKQFPSIQKIDIGILYALELTSSISVLLLAFGLVASMSNVLTKGSILTDNASLQQVYAWSQCVGIDASIPGAILRTLYYYQQKDWSRAGLYTFLSTLLLFTAAIVSGIESIQQTLNITLNAAYTHIFVSVEGLIWVRSLTIVLLIICHAVRHVHPDMTSVPYIRTIEQTQLSRKPEETIVEELPQEQKSLSAPLLQKQKAEENLKKVRTYMIDHPQAKAKELVVSLSLSLPTIRKYMKEVKDN